MAHAAWESECQDRPGREAVNADIIGNFHLLVAVSNEESCPSHLPNSTRQSSFSQHLSSLGFYSFSTNYGPDAVLAVHSGEQRDVVLPLRSFHSSGGLCQTGNSNITK